jgi:chromosome segregation ATPase
MISGGAHSQSIFNINLGSYELDKDIKKISDQIKKYSDKLNQLKFENKDSLAKETKLLRETNNLEFEIEHLKKTKVGGEAQIKERKSKISELEG